MVLTEARTGDHRRDFAVNRLVRVCVVRPVDEVQAREAARLPVTGTVVLTSDPSDLTALAAQSRRSFTVVAV